jgi:outer membrane biosynthesis protein TonB
MRFIVSILLLMILTLTTSAEEITTGNLLPNAGESASNAQSIDSTIPNVQANCSEFTSVNTTCTISNWNYQEVEVGSTSSGTGTLNYSSSLIGIETGETTSTQNMLDNGITLDSTTIIQNCEWIGSSYQCGQARSGQDEYSTTIKILDSNDTVLSTTTQSRTTDAGYYGNAYKYTDQLIYNNPGSNKFDWTWTGIDKGSSLVNLGGPNLLGALLTMTYDDTVLTEETSTALSAIETVLEELKEEEKIELENIIEFKFTSFEEPKEEIKFTSFTTFSKPVFEEKETIIETVKEEKSVYEEKEEIISAALPMVSKEEELPQEEKTLVAKGPLRMEPTKKEKKETITNEKKEKIKEEKKESKEEKEKIKEESNEEEAQEEESTSETSTASVVSTKKKAKQKKVQSKKSLVKNIDRVMDKIDKDIKDLSKNLIIKNIIKLEAMASEQASLTDYNNVEFYKPKDIYLDQLNMFDHRKIYSNITLTSYIKNDTLEIKTNKLNEIYYKKQKLLMELKELKNG